MKRASEILPDVKPTGEPYGAKEWEPVKAQKPTREQCKSAVRKLLGKPFAPSDDVAIGVVIDALREACVTTAHVDRVVGKIIAECPRWPDVTDIRAIALETRDLEMRPNPHCLHCDGSGFRTVTREIRGQRYSGSEKCSCWRLVRIDP